MSSPTPDLPQIEVRYTDLSLTVRVTAASASRSMPTVFETLSGAATALPRALVRALSQGPPPLHLPGPPAHPLC